MSQLYPSDELLYAITTGDARAYLEMRDGVPEGFDEARFLRFARKTLENIDGLGEYMSLAFDEAYRQVLEEKEGA